jgi:demethylmenaquinone methyltransferase/2-methoxy-6-polyprenyl-1,4-benzoquinol methylase
MKTEEIANLKIIKFFTKPAGILMGNKIRKLIFNPVKTLNGADVQPGQTVLEAGCGSGFFTIPAAKIIGEQGSLIALDVSPVLIEQVSKKVQNAELKNVKIVQRDALDTGLDNESIDKVLLFGVIPFPLLPLGRLLPEMHRILKSKGTMCVWLFPPLVTYGVPGAILKSGLFAYINKKNGVCNYKKE